MSIYTNIVKIDWKIKLNRRSRWYRSSPPPPLLTPPPLHTHRRSMCEVRFQLPLKTQKEKCIPTAASGLQGSQPLSCEEVGTEVGPVTSGERLVLRFGFESRLKIWNVREAASRSAVSRGLGFLDCSSERKHYDAFAWCWYTVILARTHKRPHAHAHSRTDTHARTTMWFLPSALSKSFSHTFLHPLIKYQTHFNLFRQSVISVQCS